MYSDNFEYFRPSSIEETISLLRQHEGARVLAGGHSLLPAMKLRVTSTPALVDIGRVAALKGIKVDAGGYWIGAMTTHAEIGELPLLQEGCPILTETASNIGDAQVRNRGTIGGSLAHADPAADFPTVLLALSAQISTAGPGGSRVISCSDFCTDMFTTVLGPAEIITSIWVPRLGAGEKGAYLKHHHPASRYAVVGVAAVLKQSNGVVDQARVAVGGVSVYPVRCLVAEMTLTGKAPTAETLNAAAGQVHSAVPNPIGDFYASAEFRLHLATVMAERALTEASG